MLKYLILLLLESEEQGTRLEKKSRCNCQMVGQLICWDWSPALAFGSLIEVCLACASLILVLQMVKE